MCITRDRRQQLDRWNWDGDFVVHDCIVPSNRPAVGSRRHYDIDVREFLLTERNEVMRRTVHEELRRFVQCRPDGDWARFQSRAAGAFDYRASVVADFVAQRIAYPQAKSGKRKGDKTKGRGTRGGAGEDPWQFPDETLTLGTGDCEDRALLIASLLLASGVSSFHVRVALGEMVVGDRRHDHAWVVYKSENGQWTVVDPPPASLRIAAAERRREVPEPPRYEPYFLFNDVHLWAVRRPDHDGRLRDWLQGEWRRIAPEFHGAVHLSIVEQALRGVASADVSRQLEGMFHRPVLGIFGPLVDDIDRERYEPCWHFDNGYIDEGWQHVATQLQCFRANPANVRAFALAAHAIADFYAHSNYGELVARELPGAEVPFDPSRGPLGGLTKTPDYTRGRLRLDGIAYSWNAVTMRGHKVAEAVAAWQGQLISGRYAQYGDAAETLFDELFLEGANEIPRDLTLAPDFWRRGILPHHDEIAVDDREPTRKHKLYAGDAKEHRRQFDLRKRLAIAHVRAAFLGG